MRFKERPPPSLLNSFFYFTSRRLSIARYFEITERDVGDGT
jgi:hypothetical protein